MVRNIRNILFKNFKCCFIITLNYFKEFIIIIKNVNTRTFQYNEC